MSEPIQEAMRQFDEAGAICRIVSGDLYRLSSAFKATGNSTVAAELASAAYGLEQAEQMIRKGASGCADQYSGAVAGGTHNMMSALLAMASLKDGAAP